MITVDVDKEKGEVTYTTTLNVDGRTMKLSITRYLYYAKPYQLDQSLPLPDDLKKKGITLFEDLFYWPEEFYNNPKRGHYMYSRMVETNYHHKNGEKYEIQWKEIKE
jgi:hypothetical protein